MMHFPLRGAAARKKAESDAQREVQTPRRWLPVIDTESCGGCGRCVEACSADCLEMIWSFATLTRHESCSGGGLCAAACEEQVLQMGWVALGGDHDVGRRDE